MSGAKTLSPERIAEIKAFKNTDFSDCPKLTDEELKKLRPRHTSFHDVCREEGAIRPSTAVQ